MIKNKLIMLSVCAALAGCSNSNNVETANTQAGMSPAAAMAATASVTREQIDAIIDRHTKAYMMMQPALATGLNVDASVAGDYHKRLPDYSPTGMKAVQTTMAAAANELEALDLSGLSEQDKLHVKVNKAIDLYFAGDSHFSAGYIDTWGGHLPFVVSQINGPLIDIPSVLQDQHVVNSVEDAENYITRLLAFAVVIEQVLEKVKADEKAGVILPKKLFPKTLGYLSSFGQSKPAEHSLVTSFAEKLNGVDSLDGKARDIFIGRATKVVGKKILPRFEAVYEFMNEQQHRAPNEDGIWAQPGGEDFYTHSILMLGDSILSADDIHQIGLDEVERITNEMDSILRANGKTEGTVGERVIALSNEERFIYPDSDEGREALLASLREQVKEIMVKAPDLFSTLPKEEVVVKRIPIVREQGAPGGFYVPPALDGSRPGEYYINLYDMKSNPSFGLKTLTYHEAVPGHHFQIALNMEQQGLGLMRQNGQFNAYVEGWALYSELLAKEIDMYKDDPWGDLGRLQAELYRAARLVVDTGLHHKRWSREKTVEYFYKVTGTSRTDAESAINRYMAWPGQALGYKLGMLKMVELREYAKAKLGDKFDIKAFHDLVLLPGSRPLLILEDDVKRWVAEQL